MRSHDNSLRCRTDEIKWVARHERERGSEGRRLQKRGVIRLDDLHPIYLVANSPVAV